METSEMIIFQRVLWQDNSFCLRLFTLCLNPVAWNFKTTEGYKLSKPISLKITDLLYISCTLNSELQHPNPRATTEDDYKIG